jgi:cellulose synthase/poly-beta-1,6-N-acetylglucosamine synthase-like glycosyltransferase
MESSPGAGMCASAIRLAGGTQLDSAGMLISSDGSSKQRGNLQPPERYATLEEVLCPSGCAALYRREMLDQIGLFDEDFFLYCEDTDLGLRGRWAGWTCLYAPDAGVEHRYSQTAGADSWLKAYYVERNRLFVLLKNFPIRLLARVPAASSSRYFWHLVSALTGHGSAARFRKQNSNPIELAYIAVRAHFVLLKHGPRLLRQRRAIRRLARIGAPEFEQLVARYFISPREVAEL